MNFTNDQRAVLGFLLVLVIVALISMHRPGTPPAEPWPSDARCSELGTPGAVSP